MTTPEPTPEPTPMPSSPKPKQTRLSQTDVPSYSLDQALRVVQAIADNYAYSPTRPIHVASAMNMTPSSGGFRGMTGAAVAYGLTTGASNAPEIGLTPVGLRIVRPTSEGDDLAAKREAVLKPRVIGEFLRQYDNAALPSDAIARNVLLEMGVPGDKVESVLTLIVDSAAAVGFLHDNKGKNYVDLSGTVSKQPDPSNSHQGSTSQPVSPIVQSPSPVSAPVAPLVASPTVTLSPGVHINIEIHIAADATSTTVEDIFKNMRRYVLKPDTEQEDERD
ncbi:hypothetical protein DEI97_006085 [Curtobacterium sp. MCLR17_032]|uniref:hypothetical protein n=1 Tax=Curtobacterium sp. MCLR17_032 TaxID=2175650 RepID=UPI0011B3EC7B|nr:hypothetical protein [Curtobacterium sp. MCLR17_032]WIE62708.1 hypothetical protein DEI97_006085 [Curtobacterium sp. MCLR17_032]